MCDNCTSRGIAALEAIANGEDPPPAPAETDAVTVTIPVHLPFPLVAQLSDEGFAILATTSEGYEAISGYLKSIGRACGPGCAHD
jgi:hypothetical protein